MHTCNWRSMNIRSIHSFLPSHFSKYDVGFCSFWQCDFERFESVLNMFERCFRHVAWHVPQGLLVANQTQWMRRPYCKWRRSSHQGCWSSQASTISHYQSPSITKYHQAYPRGFVTVVVPICSYTPIEQALYFHSWSVRASDSQIAWCSDPVHVISIKSPFTAIYFYPCPFHLQVFPIKISVSRLSRPSAVPMRISHFDCSDPTLRS